MKGGAPTEESPKMKKYSLTTPSDDFGNPNCISKTPSFL
jgi:hypothetical protein